MKSAQRVFVFFVCVFTPRIQKKAPKKLLALQKSKRKGGVLFIAFWITSTSCFRPKKNKSSQFVLLKKNKAKIVWSEHRCFVETYDRYATSTP
jgi:uncharacterized protein YvpB